MGQRPRMTPEGTSARGELDGADQLPLRIGGVYSDGRVTRPLVKASERQCVETGRNGRGNEGHRDSLMRSIRVHNRYGGTRRRQKVAADSHQGRAPAYTRGFDSELGSPGSCETCREGAGATAAEAVAEPFAEVAVRCWYKPNEVVVGERQLSRLAPQMLRDGSRSDAVIRKRRKGDYRRATSQSPGRTNTEDQDRNNSAELSIHRGQR